MWLIITYSSIFPMFGNDDPQFHDLLKVYDMCPYQVQAAKIWLLTYTLYMKFAGHAGHLQWIFHTGMSVDSEGLFNHWTKCLTWFYGARHFYLKISCKLPKFQRRPRNKNIVHWLKNLKFDRMTWTDLKLNTPISKFRSFTLSMMPHHQHILFLSQWSKGWPQKYFLNLFFSLRYCNFW